MLNLSEPDQVALIETLESLVDDIYGNQVDDFYNDDALRAAYEKHLDCFDAGKSFRERCVFGGNRVGKSTLGAYEVALHLTGEYPPWWTGKRFIRPINAWACGINRDQTRDVVQVKLMGPPEAIGSGMIRKDLIRDVRKRQGIPDAFDTVRVKHTSGGTSTLQFKSYAEGRIGFQGRKMEIIWLDEEPDQDIFQECLLRTTSTSEYEPSGVILMTMTPMKGLSEVSQHFLDDDGRMAETGDRYATQIGWEDIPHISESEKADLIRGMTRHEVDARTKGYPSLGAGAVYAYSEDEIIIEPFQIDIENHGRMITSRSYFKRAYGLDVGWNCTAAIFLAVDPDSKMHYVVDEYKVGKEKAPVHAAAVNRIGKYQFGAIDPGSRGRSQSDGEQLIEEYRDLNLKLVAADNRVEAGIHRVQMLMATGSLKIFSHCHRTLAEMRKYSRNEDGKIMKRDDHLMDALRYVIMTEEVHRVAKPFGKPRVKRAMA